MGSGCGSVGRAIASDSRGPLFVSSHQHDLYRAITVNFIEKTKIKRKEAGNGPFLKSSWQYVLNRPTCETFLQLSDCWTNCAKSNFTILVDFIKSISNGFMSLVYA